MLNTQSRSTGMLIVVSRINLYFVWIFLKNCILTKKIHNIKLCPGCIRFKHSTENHNTQHNNFNFLKIMVIHSSEQFSTSKIIQQVKPVDHFNESQIVIIVFVAYFLFIEQFLRFN